MLNVLSVNPPKQYEACPFCFTELEKEAKIEKEEVTETPKKPKEPQIEKVKESNSRVFGRVRSLIPNRNKKEEEIEEAKPKDTAKKEKDDYSDKKEKKKEKSSSKDDKSGCPEHFGYLANRPSDVPIPQACLTCPKMVDCMLSPKN